MSMQYGRWAHAGITAARFYYLKNRLADKKGEHGALSGSAKDFSTALVSVICRIALCQCVSKIRLRITSCPKNMIFDAELYFACNQIPKVPMQGRDNGSPTLSLA
ncbi:MAG: hypothetical protein ACJ8G3_09500 [Burkholderiaceae bacterium]